MPYSIKIKVSLEVIGFLDKILQWVSEDVVYVSLLIYTYTEYQISGEIEVSASSKL